jgi:hypothetical protein
VNANGLSPFPALPQILRSELGGDCCTLEENDAAALLLGLREERSPAALSRLTINSPTRVDRVLDSFPDQTITPEQRSPTPVRRLFTEAADSVRQTNGSGNDERRPSPSLNLARNGGPRDEVSLDSQRVHKNTNGEKMATHMNERSPSPVEEAGVDGDLLRKEKDLSVRPEPMRAQNTTQGAAITKISPLSTPTAKPISKKTRQILNDINHLPLAVFSPKAPVGLSGPITFVTPTLNNFMAKPQLRNRWKRASIITRQITQFELGHWVIETKTWTPKLQLSFWKDLTKQISLRQAGISTWCKRIPDPDQLGTVKVFCWGEIVEHLYIFLFTIADTGVSSQEVCWLDGKDEVVVRVRHRQGGR